MMQAHTVQVAENGRVFLQLPQGYWGKNVDFYIFPSPSPENGVKPKKQLRGRLRKYADPGLMNREESAWMDAVRDGDDNH